MAVSGHQTIYGGDEGLRHHLCVSHGEHLDEGASREHMEELHDEEHGYNPGHRGEWGCYEHDPADEPTEFHDMHESGGIGEIHRGIGVSLPDRVHRVVHDESRPAHERAQALLDHVSDHPGHWGMHWTTENRVAEDFAERSAQHEANEDQRGRYALDDFTWGHEPEYKDTPLGKPGTAVVFHAHEPSLEALETDGHRLSNGGVYGWSQHGEREVPIRDTHALDLKGISWAPMHSADDVPGHGEYVHHDFGHEPREATLLKHFEAAIQVTGVSYEELDRHLEDWFHPQQLDAARTRHPRSGYEVETGEELRMHQPRRGEGEGPMYFHVLDHGDPHDPGHNSLLYPKETGQRPVEHVYRGVSAEELSQARRRGYVQSDGRGTLAAWEGTNADPDPRTAVSYLPHGATGHILKIRVHPDDGWFTHEADSYARTRQPVPWSRVEAVSPPITKDQKYGAIERIGGHEPRTAAAPQRWYHGSNEEFESGDAVLTAAQAGRPTRGGKGDEHRVWVSSDPHRAGAYGANVYEVTTHDKPVHTRGTADEHDTSGATVVRRLTVQETRDLSPSYQEQARAYEKAMKAQAALDQPESDVPAAERTENVRHMLDHYQPYDFPTWDEVSSNNVWHHPVMRALVDDVKRNGVKRPIPVDYEQDPPMVRNGHTRLLAADLAGVEHVPTRQYMHYGDPDDESPHWHEEWKRREAALVGHFEAAASDEELLPERPGLWYRAHLRDEPLDEAHARSRPLRNIWDRNLPVTSYDPGDPGRDLRERVNATVGQSGYSSFASPWHLASYMHRFGWPRQPEQTNFDQRHVVAFHGTLAGRGMDREALVMPKADHSCCGRVIHSAMPWEDFSGAMREKSGLPEHEYDDMLTNDKTPAGKSAWNAWGPNPVKKSIRRNEEKQQQRTAAAELVGHFEAAQEPERRYYHASDQHFDEGDELSGGHRLDDLYVADTIPGAHKYYTSGHVYEVSPHAEPQPSMKGEYTVPGATVLRKVPSEEVSGAVRDAYNAPDEKAKRDRTNRRQREHVWRVKNDRWYHGYSGPDQPGWDEYTAHWYPEGPENATPEQQEAARQGHPLPPDVHRWIHGTEAAVQMIDLYHHTDPEIAAKIYREKRMISKENTGSIFFTTDPDSEYAAGFGDGEVHVRMPRAHLDRLDEQGKAWQDDEFPSGEQHWAIHHSGLRPEHFVEPKTSREAAVQHQASGETAPEGHQIWAEPHGVSPVAAEVYRNMTTREPGDEHGSAWYQGISYHGPYHVIRHPQTRQVWVVDRHGRDANPTIGHYGNPERDGNWGEHQAWQHQYGLESAGPEAHRFGTPDDMRFNEMDKRVPEFPHSRVDPEDVERVNRPAARVHAPEGYSPSDEYHGSYEVVRHPETGGYHVVDNQGRHAMTGNPGGFKTQLQGERSRDYIERKQRSKEIGRGIADSIFNKGMDVLDPGGTPESRESEENMRTASEMIDRYHGGLGEIKFDDDEEGGAPYYEREHLRGNGTPSGWYVKHYGGPQADVYHRATGDESHQTIHLPQHPEDENISMTPRLHPQFGDEHLAGALKEWHDDQEGGERAYLEANDPRISRWKQRHTGAAQHEVVAHFEDKPEPRPFPVTAAASGEEYGPQPKYQAAPEDLSQEEKDAHFERSRAERHDWTSRIRHGLGTGALTHDRARELGYYGDGSETPEEYRGHDGSVKRFGWQPLPERLYHATTDMPSVREHGLKSRSELGQVRGKGLGAGPDDTISLTSDHGSAENILRAMHEHHDVVTGKKTPAQMIEEARTGHGAKKPFLHDLAIYSGETWNEGEPMPRGLDAKVRGVELKRGGYLHTPEEMAEREGPGWRPHPESDELKGRNGETLYNSWERDSSPEHRREQASGLYRDFAVARAHAGGPEDPLFTGTDVHGFAAMNPAHFGIVHVRPRPGAQGFPISSLHEWRTTTGDALEVHRAERLEHGHLKEAAVSRIAALVNPHNQEMAGRFGRHWGEQDTPETWYHGSPYAYHRMEPGMVADSEADMDEPSHTHWNNLLGSHFAGHEGTAANFIDSSSSGNYEGSSGYIYHAKLHVRNPKRYASEYDMDREAYGHEFDRGNHPVNHDPDFEGEWEGDPSLGHHEDLRNQPETLTVRDPITTGEKHLDNRGRFMRWLSVHPDKAGIAERFKGRLEAAGHDGVTYGNEIEENNGGSGGTCAIAFHPHQVQITQRHAYDPRRKEEYDREGTVYGCKQGEEAEQEEKHWPSHDQMELPFGEHQASVVAHFASHPYADMNDWGGDDEEPQGEFEHPEYGNRDEETGLYHHPEKGWHCHVCEGFHDDPDEVDAHDTAHTDWDEEYPRLPEHMHRGVLLHGHADLTRLTRGAEPGHVARTLLGEIGDLGDHWTAHEPQARHYAVAGTRGYHSTDPSSFNVVVHARRPEREDIETNPWTLADRGVYGMNAHEDKEIPLRQGAPVHVTGVSWKGDGEPDTAWRRHDFGDGAKHTAALEATASEAALNSLNPTGGLFADYDPQSRASAPLGPNMTTLAETKGVHPDTPIRLYRGAPAGQKSIVPGDFVTDNPRLARDYAGEGSVLSLDAAHGDVLDDRTEPGGGEYIYRPREKNEPAGHTAALEEAPRVPSFTWKHLTYGKGPEGGYDEVTENVSGPFYHGSRAKDLRPGTQLTKGRKTNPWGDEGNRSQWVHFTTDLSGARDYARQAGGHVFEVSPSGEVHMGYGGGEWKSKDPLEVIRRVPDDELPAVVAHFGEEAELPEHPHPRTDEELRHHLESPQGHGLYAEEHEGENPWDLHHEEHGGGWDNPDHKHEEFYHGTSLDFPDYEEPPAHIVPQGRSRVFPGMHSGEYAFATSKPSAWWYAEAAHRAGLGHQPRVLRVRPTGPFEEDPNYDKDGTLRSVMEGDVRSRHPWAVTGEEEIPEEHRREDEDLEKWGREGSLQAAAAVTAHFEDPYVAPPQDHEEAWSHLQEMHGARQSADSDKTPNPDFVSALHRKLHGGRREFPGAVPHNHGAQAGSDAPAQPRADLSRMFTPIPPEELEAQRRAREPRPERLDDREYSIDDVSRHYDWEGFDPYEIEHLVHRPEHAMFTREDVPVHSLRLAGEHGRLVPPHSYEDIAAGDDDEGERLRGLERGYDNDEPVPPIVVVRHGEHHIIADGSHRAAIHARQGRTHIPAFVTERTIFPEQHTAAVTAAYDWETDEGPFTWKEIAHRHPRVYGDDEDHVPGMGEGGGEDIADAAAELYHDRPSHPYSETGGELHPYHAAPEHEMQFHPRTVDVNRIDYMRVDRDEHDPRVERAKKGFQDWRGREKIPPLILVHRHGVYHVADGHHRANGAEQAHWPSVRAYVAYSPHEDEPFAGRDGDPPHHGPFHGAETSDRPTGIDHNGEPARRISYPGFPHTADAGIPPREAALGQPEPTEHCGLDNPHAPHDWCRGTTFDEFYAGEPGFCGSTRAHPEHGECFGLEADLPQRSGPELEGGDEFRMAPRPEGQPHDPVFGSARGPVELDTARDHVLVSSGPVDTLVQAVSAIGSWAPPDARDLPMVFTALASGLRKVGALVDEMPVHPLVAEAVHAMADGARTAAVYAADALPPEASWETGSSPNR